MNIFIPRRIEDRKERWKKIYESYIWKALVKNEVEVSTEDITIRDEDINFDSLIFYLRNSRMDLAFPY
jgi:hypothetical protein